MNLSSNGNSRRFLEAMTAPCNAKTKTLAIKLVPGDSDGKESTCKAGDLGSIPGLGWPSGEGNGYLLQYSCLENSIDRGAWRATVYGVAKNRTWLSDQAQHCTTSSQYTSKYLDIPFFCLHDKQIGKMSSFFKF